MLKEAIFATFTIVDLAHTVRDKRRRHKARKAQHEYLQQRTLQLQAAAAQEAASRPQKSVLDRHRDDARSLTTHACLLALVLLGITLWARAYLPLGACTCVALLCIHAAALTTRQSILRRKVREASFTLSAKAGLPASIQELNGTWIKDKAASDSMEPAMDLMQLNGIIRKAINLVTGAQIRVDESMFELAVTSIIPGFKIKERYLMNGAGMNHRRRDLRRGGARGQVSITAEGELRLSLAWDDPHGGTGYDLYRLLNYNTMCVRSLICVGNGTATYNVIYRRKA